MTTKSGAPVAEKIKQHADDLAEEAREKVTEKARAEAETLRDTAAEETQKAANAAEAAAQEFDPASMQAQAIEQIASRIEDIATQIRSSDIDRIAQTVRQTAERNPMMFLAGFALAGFAVTRFLKARDPNPRQSYRSETDPWSVSHDYRGPSHDLTSRGSV
ncbi:MAG: hypothetical protein ACU0GG_04665 [Paracoccaceae bacterium]